MASPMLGASEDVEHKCTYKLHVIYMIAPPPAVGGEGGCGPQELYLPAYNVDIAPNATQPQSEKARQQDSAQKAEIAN